MIKQELQRTNSLLIMIQQVRQNLNAGPFGQKYMTAGGEAPFFYSTHCVWLSKIESLKKQGRKIGSRVKADVKKNKLTGKLRDVEFDIFYDHGVDDIGSMIDFMMDEKIWTKSGNNINAIEFNIALNRSALITHIEANNLESVLIDAVATAWKSIEDSLLLHRKPRY